MQKAKFFNRNSVRVIDYDRELSKINSKYRDLFEEEGVTDDVINPILEKKDSERTYEELQLIIIRKNLEDEKKEELKLLSGYKEFVATKYEGELGEFDFTEPYYIEEDDKIIRKWEVVHNDSLKISAKISRLKKELENSDYKIIKCYEASMTQNPMPYNLEELVAERESKRAEINRLEELL